MNDVWIPKMVSIPKCAELFGIGIYSMRKIVKIKGFPVCYLPAGRKALINWEKAVEWYNSNTDLIMEGKKSKFLK